jgi:hypothetical protein
MSLVLKKKQAMEESIYVDTMNNAPASRGNKKCERCISVGMNALKFY